MSHGHRTNTTALQHHNLYLTRTVTRGALLLDLSSAGGQLLCVSAKSALTEHSTAFPGGFTPRQHLFLFYFILAISSLEEPEGANCITWSSSQTPSRPAALCTAAGPAPRTAPKHRNTSVGEHQHREWLGGNCCSPPARPPAWWQAGGSRGSTSAPESPYRGVSGAAATQCHQRRPSRLEQGWSRAGCRGCGFHLLHSAVVSISSLLPACHQALAIMFRMIWDEEPNAVNSA